MMQAVMFLLTRETLNIDEIVILKEPFLFAFNFLTLT